jgi:hypothetical protein
MVINDTYHRGEDQSGPSRHAWRIIADRDGEPAVSAILVSVADGKVRHAFLQVDRERLSHIRPPN